MKNAANKVFTLVLLVVFFVGLSVLLYPSVSQYWNARVQSRAVMDYDRMMQAMSTEDFAEELEKAYDYNRRLAALPFPMVDYRPLTKQYEEAANVIDTGMMGYIAIDKLQVEIPIYHGTTDMVLNSAVGHFEGTSLPVGGESTHSVLMAHRGLPHAKLFTDLDKMQMGDTFTINILGEVLTYEVVQIKVVEPTEIEDLQIVEGEDYCTLVTCTPYGINSHRLLVQGKRIETVAKKTLYVTSEAYLIDRIIVTPMVAMPILFVLIVYVTFKPVKKKVKLDFDEEDTLE